MHKSEAQPLTSTNGLKIGDILGDICVLYTNDSIDKYQYVVEKFGVSDKIVYVSAKGLKTQECRVTNFFLLKTGEPRIRGHRMTRIFA